MYIIQKGCLCCHNCALECPVQAIDYRGTHYEIDQDKCIGCGLCQRLCNVGAVVNTEAPDDSVAHELQELRCDLVVIGCGGSGAIAAARAAERSGKQVIVLEKAEKYGGSAWFAGFEVMGGGPGGPGPGPGGPGGGAGDRFQGKVSKEIQQVARTAPKAFSDWMLTMDGVSEHWVEKPAPFGPGKAVGLKGRTYFNLKCRDEAIGPGRGGSFVVQTMVDQFDHLGVKLLTGTGAKKLLTENGRITGVLAQDKGGDILIHCDAVVVSAGGFAWNDELLTKYWPWFMTDDPTAEPVHRFAAPTNTGDATVLGESAGAWVDYDNFTVNLFGPVHHPFSFCLFKFACEPEIISVNREGKRFYDESFFPNGAAKIGSQPGRTAWSIVDANTLKLIADRLIAGNDGWIHKDYLTEIETELKLDTPLKKADTIAELAQLCGIDPEALQATIDQYNADCAAGADSQFGKKPETMRPILQAPFYAIYGKMATDGAFGGIRVNEKMEALRPDGTVLPGLYATGDNAAGWCVRVPGPGDNRLMCTNEMSWAVASGFTAGNSAAEYLTR